MNGSKQVKEELKKRYFNHRNACKLFAFFVFYLFLAMPMSSFEVSAPDCPDPNNPECPTEVAGVTPADAASYLSNPGADPAQMNAYINVIGRMTPEQIASIHPDNIPAFFALIESSPRQDIYNSMSSLTFAQVRDNIESIPDAAYLSEETRNDVMREINPNLPEGFFFNTDSARGVPGRGSAVKINKQGDISLGLARINVNDIDPASEVTGIKAVKTDDGKEELQIIGADDKPLLTFSGEIQIESKADGMYVKGTSVKIEAAEGKEAKVKGIGSGRYELDEGTVIKIGELIVTAEGKDTKTVMEIKPDGKMRFENAVKVSGNFKGKKIEAAVLHVGGFLEFDPVAGTIVGKKAELKLYNSEGVQTDLVLGGFTARYVKQPGFKYTDEKEKESEIGEMEGISITLDPAPKEGEEGDESYYKNLISGDEVYSTDPNAPLTVLVCDGNDLCDKVAVALRTSLIEQKELIKKVDDINNELSYGKWEKAKELLKGEDEQSLYEMCKSQETCEQAAALYAEKKLASGVEKVIYNLLKEHQGVGNLVVLTRDGSYRFSAGINRIKITDELDIGDGKKEKFSRVYESFETHTVAYIPKKEELLIANVNPDNPNLGKFASFDFELGVLDDKELVKVMVSSEYRKQGGRIHTAFRANDLGAVAGQLYVQGSDGQWKLKSGLKFVTPFKITPADSVNVINFDQDGSHAFLTLGKQVTDGNLFESVEVGGTQIQEKVEKYAQHRQRIASTLEILRYLGEDKLALYGGVMTTDAVFNEMKNLYDEDLKELTEGLEMQARLLSGEEYDNIKVLIEANKLNAEGQKKEAVDLYNQVSGKHYNLAQKQLGQMYLIDKYYQEAYQALENAIKLDAVSDEEKKLLNDARLLLLKAYGGYAGDSKVSDADRAVIQGAAELVLLSILGLGEKGELSAEDKKLLSDAYGAYAEFLEANAAALKSQKKSEEDKKAKASKSKIDRLDGEIDRLMDEAVKNYADAFGNAVTAKDRYDLSLKLAKAIATKEGLYTNDLTALTVEDLESQFRIALLQNQDKLKFMTPQELALLQKHFVAAQFIEAAGTIEGKTKADAEMRASLLQRAIEQLPEDYDANIQLAKALYDAGRFELADAYKQKAEQILNEESRAKNYEYSSKTIGRRIDLNKLDMKLKYDIAEGMKGADLDRAISFAKISKSSASKVWVYYGVPDLEALKYVAKSGILAASKSGGCKSCEVALSKIEYAERNKDKKGLTGILSQLKMFQAAKELGLIVQGGKWDGVRAKLQTAVNKIYAAKRKAAKARSGGGTGKTVKKKRPNGTPASNEAQRKARQQLRNIARLSAAYARAQDVKARAEAKKALDAAKKAYTEFKKANQELLKITEENKKIMDEINKLEKGVMQLADYSERLVNFNEIYGSKDINSLTLEGDAYNEYKKIMDFMTGDAGTILAGAIMPSEFEIDDLYDGSSNDIDGTVIRSGDDYEAKRSGLAEEFSGYYRPTASVDPNTKKPQPRGSMWTSIDRTGEIGGAAAVNMAGGNPNFKKGYSIETKDDFDRMAYLASTANNDQRKQIWEGMNRRADSYEAADASFDESGAGAAYSGKQGEYNWKMTYHQREHNARAVADIAMKEWVPPEKVVVEGKEISGDEWKAQNLLDNSYRMKGISNDMYEREVDHLKDLNEVPEKPLGYSIRENLALVAGGVVELVTFGSLGGAWGSTGGFVYDLIAPSDADYEKLGRGSVLISEEKNRKEADLANYKGIVDNYVYPLWEKGVKVQAPAGMEEEFDRMYSNDGYKESVNLMDSAGGLYNDYAPSWLGGQKYDEADKHMFMMHGVAEAVTSSENDKEGAMQVKDLLDNAKESNGFWTKTEDAFVTGAKNPGVVAFSLVAGPILPLVAGYLSKDSRTREEEEEIAELAAQRKKELVSIAETDKAAEEVNKRLELRMEDAKKGNLILSVETIDDKGNKVTVNLDPDSKEFRERLQGMVADEVLNEMESGINKNKNLVKDSIRDPEALSDNAFLLDIDVRARSNLALVNENPELVKSITGGDLSRLTQDDRLITLANINANREMIGFYDEISRDSDSAASVAGVGSIDRAANNINSDSYAYKALGYAELLGRSLPFVESIRKSTTDLGGKEANLLESSEMSENLRVGEIMVGNNRVADLLNVKMDGLSDAAINEIQKQQALEAANQQVMNAEYELDSSRKTVGGNNAWDWNAYDYVTKAFGQQDNQLAMREDFLKRANMEYDATKATIDFLDESGMTVKQMNDLRANGQFEEKVNEILKEKYGKDYDPAKHQAEINKIAGTAAISFANPDKITKYRTADNLGEDDANYFNSATATVLRASTTTTDVGMLVASGMLSVAAAAYTTAAASTAMLKAGQALSKAAKVGKTMNTVGRWMERTGEGMKAVNLMKNAKKIKDTAKLLDTINDLKKSEKIKTTLRSLEKAEDLFKAAETAEDFAKYGKTAAKTFDNFAELQSHMKYAKAIDKTLGFAVESYVFPTAMNTLDAGLKGEKFHGWIGPLAGATDWAHSAVFLGAPRLGGQAFEKAAAQIYTRSLGKTATVTTEQAVERLAANSAYKAAAIVNEGLIFGATAAALEGRMPTLTDFAHGFATLGGLKLGGALAHRGLNIREIASKGPRIDLVYREGKLKSNTDNAAKAKDALTETGVDANIAVDLLGRTTSNDFLKEYNKQASQKGKPELTPTEAAEIYNALQTGNSRIVGDAVGKINLERQVSQSRGESKLVEMDMASFDTARRNVELRSESDNVESFMDNYNQVARENERPPLNREQAAKAYEAAEAYKRAEAQRADFEAEYNAYHNANRYNDAKKTAQDANAKASKAESDFNLDVNTYLGSSVRAREADLKSKRSELDRERAENDLPPITDAEISTMARAEVARDVATSVAEVNRNTELKTPEAKQKSLVENLKGKGIELNDYKPPLGRTVSADAQATRILDSGNARQEAFKEASDKSFERDTLHMEYLDATKNLLENKREKGEVDKADYVENTLVLDTQISELGKAAKERKLADLKDAGADVNSALIGLKNADTALREAESKNLESEAKVREADTKLSESNTPENREARRAANQERLESQGKLTEARTEYEVAERGVQEAKAKFQEVKADYLKTSQKAAEASKSANEQLSEKRQVDVSEREALDIREDANFLTDELTALKREYDITSGEFIVKQKAAQDAETNLQKARTGNEEGRVTDSELRRFEESKRNADIAAERAMIEQLNKMIEVQNKEIGRNSIERSVLEAEQTTDLYTSRDAETKAKLDQSKADMDVFIDGMSEVARNNVLKLENDVAASEARLKVLEAEKAGSSESEIGRLQREANQLDYERRLAHDPVSELIRVEGEINTLRYELDVLEGYPGSEARVEEIRNKIAELEQSRPDIESSISDMARKLQLDREAIRREIDKIDNELNPPEGTPPPLPQVRESKNLERAELDKQLRNLEIRIDNIDASLSSEKAVELGLRTEYRELSDITLSESRAQMEYLTRDRFLKEKIATKTDEMIDYAVSKDLASLDSVRDVNSVKREMSTAVDQRLAEVDAEIATIENNRPNIPLSRELREYNAEHSAALEQLRLEKMKLEREKRNLDRRVEVTESTSQTQISIEDAIGTVTATRTFEMAAEQRGRVNDRTSELDITDSTGVERKLSDSEVRELNDVISSNTDIINLRSELDQFAREKGIRNPEEFVDNVDNILRGTVATPQQAAKLEISKKSKGFDTSFRNTNSELSDATNHYVDSTVSGEQINRKIAELETSADVLKKQVEENPLNQDAIKELRDVNVELARAEKQKWLEDNLRKRGDSELNELYDQMSRGEITPAQIDARIKDMRRQVDDMKTKGEDTTALENRINDLEMFVEYTVKTGNEELDLLINDVIRTYEKGVMKDEKRFFNLRAEQAEVMQDFFKDGKLGVEFLLAGGKTSTIAPIVMAIEALSSGRKGVFIVPEGKSMDAVKTILEGMKAVGLTVYHFDNLYNMEVKVNAIKNHDVIVVPANNVGFVISNILKGNPARPSETIAAREILKLLTRNVQVIGDEIQIIGDPKLQYITGGEGAALRDVVVRDSEMLYDVFKQIGVFGEGGTINRDTLRKITIEDQQMHKGFTRETINQIADQVASRKGLRPEEVREIFDNANNENRLPEIRRRIGEERVNEIIEILDSVNQFADGIAKFKEGDFVREKGLTRPANEGAAQVNQQYSNERQAAAMEIIGAHAYQEAPNLRSVKTSAEAVKASMATYFEMVSAPSSNSRLNVFSGGFGSQLLTIQFGYKIGTKLSDAVKKKYLGRDGSVIDSRIIGTKPAGSNVPAEQGTQSAIDWINRMHSSNEVVNLGKNTRGPLGENHVAIVIEQSGYSPNDIMNKLMDTYSEHSFLLKEATGDFKLWVREGNRLVYKGTLSSEQGRAFFSEQGMVGRGEVGKTVMILGKGAATGTDVPTTRDVPFIHLTDGGVARYLQDQGYGRSERTRGEVSDIFTLVTDAEAGITKEQLVKRLDARENYENKDNFYRASINAIDAVGSKFFENMILGGRDGTRKVELARDILKEFQNRGRDSKNVALESEMQTSLDGLQSKLNSNVEFFRELATNPKYQEFRDTLTASERQVLEANTRTTPLKFAESTVEGGKSIYGAENFGEFADIVSRTITSDRYNSEVTKDAKSSDVEAVQYTPSAETAARAEAISGREQVASTDFYKTTSQPMQDYLKSKGVEPTNDYRDFETYQRLVVTDAIAADENFVPVRTTLGFLPFVDDIDYTATFRSLRVQEAIDSGILNVDVDQIPEKPSFLFWGGGKDYESLYDDLQLTLAEIELQARLRSQAQPTLTRPSESIKTEFSSLVNQKSAEAKSDYESAEVGSMRNMQAGLADIENKIGTIAASILSFDRAIAELSISLPANSPEVTALRERVDNLRNRQRELEAARTNKLRQMDSMATGTLLPGETYSLLRSYLDSRVTEEESKIVADTNADLIESRKSLGEAILALQEAARTREEAENIRQTWQDWIDLVAEEEAAIIPETPTPDIPVVTIEEPADLYRQSLQAYERYKAFKSVGSDREALLHLGDSYDLMWNTFTSAKMSGDEYYSEKAETMINNLGVIMSGEDFDPAVHTRNLLTLEGRTIEQINEEVDENIQEGEGLLEQYYDHISNGRFEAAREALTNAEFTLKNAQGLSSTTDNHEIDRINEILGIIRGETGAEDIIGDRITDKLREARTARMQSEGYIAAEAEQAVNSVKDAYRAIQEAYQLAPGLDYRTPDVVQELNNIQGVMTRLGIPNEEITAIENSVRNLIADEQAQADLGAAKEGADEAFDEAFDEDGGFILGEEDEGIILDEEAEEPEAPTPEAPTPETPAFSADEIKMMEAKAKVLENNFVANNVPGVQNVPIAPVSRRQVVMGDIHGSMEGVLLDLMDAGLLNPDYYDAIQGASLDQLRSMIERGELDDIWIGGESSFVQMGDGIDRGAAGIKVDTFLRHLQQRARTSGGMVVRLLGNHELMFLQGMGGDDASFFDWVRNGGRTVLEELGISDDNMFDFRTLRTNSELLRFFNLLKADISVGSIVAAYQAGGRIFVHGGVLPHISRGRNLDDTVLDLNQRLRNGVQVNDFSDGIFNVGASRGGSGMPGIFWTDYSDLLSQESSLDVQQVVAHSPVTRVGVGGDEIIMSPQGKIIDVDVGHAETYGGNRGYLTMEGTAANAYALRPDAANAQNQLADLMQDIADARASQTQTIPEAPTLPEELPEVPMAPMEVARQNLRNSIDTLEFEASTLRQLGEELTPAEQATIDALQTAASNKQDFLDTITQQPVDQISAFIADGLTDADYNLLIDSANAQLRIADIQEAEAELSQEPVAQPELPPLAEPVAPPATAGDAWAAVENAGAEFENAIRENNIGALISSAVPYARSLLDYENRIGEETDVDGKRTEINSRLAAARNAYQNLDVNQRETIQDLIDSLIIVENGLVKAHDAAVSAAEESLLEDPAEGSRAWAAVENAYAPLAAAQRSVVDAEMRMRNARTPEAKAAANTAFVNALEAYAQLNDEISTYVNALEWYGRWIRKDSDNRVAAAANGELDTQKKFNERHIAETAILKGLFAAKTNSGQRIKEIYGNTLAMQTRIREIFYFMGANRQNKGIPLDIPAEPGAPNAERARARQQAFEQTLRDVANNIPDMDTAATDEAANPRNPDFSVSDVTSTPDFLETSLLGELGDEMRFSRWALRKFIKKIPGVGRFVSEPTEADVAKRNARAFLSRKPVYFSAAPRGLASLLAINPFSLRITMPYTLSDIITSRSNFLKTHPFMRFGANLGLTVGIGSVGSILGGRPIDIVGSLAYALLWEPVRTVSYGIIRNNHARGYQQQMALLANQKIAEAREALQNGEDKTALNLLEDARNLARGGVPGGQEVGALKTDLIDRTIQSVRDAINRRDAASTAEEREAITSHRTLLETLAKYETPLEGTEQDFIYHQTFSERLGDIHSSGGLKATERESLADLDKYVDHFAPEDLVRRGLTRSNAVYAQVDEKLVAATGRTGSTDVVLKIKTTGLDGIVVSNEQVGEINLDLERVPSESSEETILEEVEGRAAGYWEDAVPLSDFKRFYATDEDGWSFYKDQREGSYATISIPEVLIAGQVPNSQIQIERYPPQIQDLFDRLGVKTAGEALSLLEESAEERASDTAREDSRRQASGSSRAVNFYTDSGSPYAAYVPAEGVIYYDANRVTELLGREGLLDDQVRMDVWGHEAHHQVIDFMRTQHNTELVPEGVDEEDIVRALGARTAGIPLTGSQISLLREFDSNVDRLPEELQAVKDFILSDNARMTADDYATPQTDPTAKSGQILLMLNSIRPGMGMAVEAGDFNDAEFLSSLTARQAKFFADESTGNQDSEPSPVISKAQQEIELSGVGDLLSNARSLESNFRDTGENNDGLAAAAFYARAADAAAEAATPVIAGAAYQSAAGLHASLGDWANAQKLYGLASDQYASIGDSESQRARSQSQHANLMMDAIGQAWNLGAQTPTIRVLAIDIADLRAAIDSMPGEGAGYREQALRDIESALTIKQQLPEIKKQYAQAQAMINDFTARQQAGDFTGININDEYVAPMQNLLVGLQTANVMLGSSTDISDKMRQNLQGELSQIINRLETARLDAGIEHFFPTSLRANIDNDIRRAAEAAALMDGVSEMSPERAQQYALQVEKLSSTLALDLAEVGMSLASAKKELGSAAEQHPIISQMDLNYKLIPSMNAKLDNELAPALKQRASEIPDVPVRQIQLSKPQQDIRDYINRLRKNKFMTQVLQDALIRGGVSENDAKAITRLDIQVPSETSDITAAIARYDAGRLKSALQSAVNAERESRWRAMPESAYADYIRQNNLMENEDFIKSLEFLLPQDYRGTIASEVVEDILRLTDPSVPASRKLEIVSKYKQKGDDRVDIKTFLDNVNNIYDMMQCCKNPGQIAALTNLMQPILDRAYEEKRRIGTSEIDGVPIDSVQRTVSDFRIRINNWDGRMKFLVGWGLRKTTILGIANSLSKGIDAKIDERTSRTQSELDDQGGCSNCRAWQDSMDGVRAYLSNLGITDPVFADSIVSLMAADTLLEYLEEGDYENLEQAKRQILADAQVGTPEVTDFIKSLDELIKLMAEEALSDEEEFSFGFDAPVRPVEVKDSLQSEADDMSERAAEQVNAMASKSFVERVADSQLNSKIVDEGGILRSLIDSKAEDMKNNGDYVGAARMLLSTADSENELGRPEVAAVYYQQAADDFMEAARLQESAGDNGMASELYLQAERAYQSSATQYSRSGIAGASTQVKNSNDKSELAYEGYLRNKPAEGEVAPTVEAPEAELIESTRDVVTVLSEIQRGVDPYSLSATDSWNMESSRPVDAPGTGHLLPRGVAAGSVLDAYNRVIGRLRQQYPGMDETVLHTEAFRVAEAHMGSYVDQNDLFLDYYESLDMGPGEARFKEAMKAFLAQQDMNRQDSEEFDVEFRAVGNTDQALQNIVNARQVTTGIIPGITNPLLAVFIDQELQKPGQCG